MNMTKRITRAIAMNTVRPTPISLTSSQPRYDPITPPPTRSIPRVQSSPILSDSGTFAAAQSTDIKRRHTVEKKNFAPVALLTTSFRQKKAMIIRSRGMDIAAGPKSP